jgi:hypothetical protein
VTHEEHADFRSFETEKAAQSGQVGGPPILGTPIEALLAHVQEVEMRLARGCHEQFQPPSSDGLGSKTHRLGHAPFATRVRKKPGGHPGHRGNTLPLVETPNEVVQYHPAMCAACQTSLVGVPVKRVGRRQMRDLRSRTVQQAISGCFRDWRTSGSLLPHRGRALDPPQSRRSAPDDVARALCHRITPLPATC